MLECLDRDTLDTLQVTSSLFATSTPATRLPSFASSTQRHSSTRTTSCKYSDIAPRKRRKYLAFTPFPTSHPPSPHLHYIFAPLQNVGLIARGKAARFGHPCVCTRRYDMIFPHFRTWHILDRARTTAMSRPASSRLPSSALRTKKSLSRWTR